MARPSHRDDIDALRAVAVGLVILFHFGVPGFSGGFVGVDVFFVISGFLIGGIIDRELSARQFSLVAFYERRVRRIFPALFAVLAVTAGVAALLLYPPDYERFGRSAGAAALFWSNIFFFNTAGYWDTAASSKPLLHTWSLAVEEQFYLVFPLMLFAIRKWAVRWRLAALGAMAVASFGASVWAVHATPTAAFYLAPYRFWEFVIGAMLNFLPPVGAMIFASALRPWGEVLDAAKQSRGKGGQTLAIPPSPPLAGLPPAVCFQAARVVCPRGAEKIASGMTAFLGLAMILAAGVLLPKGGVFPGWAALLPCAGAALVIAAGPDNAVSRALAWRPVVFVGLISYSLYLWHWPVIVLARQWLGVLKPWQVAVCAAVTFAASVLSWRFVEQPFRNRDAVTRKPLFLAAGAAMACACLFALVTIRTGGLPNRFDPKIVAIMEQELAPRPAEARCFGVAAKDVSAARLCGIGAEAQPATFVLWGDSHAEAILPAVADIARKHNRRGLFAGAPSCAPLIGVNLSNAPKCRAFNDRVLAMILRHKEITTVILEARWGKAAAGTAYGNEGNGFVAISDDLGRATKPEDNAAIFARGLDRTVAALRAGGKQVLLVGPVPEIGFTVPQVLAKLVEMHREDWVVSPPAEKFYDREKAVLPVFQKAATQDGVFAVYPHDYLCASGRCAVRNNGIPLYRDEHHLSDYGAKKLEPLLSRAIDPLFDKVS